MQNNIRKIRTDKGWTQEQLAERLGTSVSQVNRLELGKRRLSQIWMDRLSKVFECDPRDLLPEKEYIPQELKDFLGSPEAKLLKLTQKEIKHLKNRPIRNIVGILKPQGYYWIVLALREIKEIEEEKK